MATANVSIDQKAKELVVRIPLQEATPSKSGKTKVIATTNGNQVSNAKVDGKDVYIGLNAYYKE